MRAPHDRPGERWLVQHCQGGPRCRDAHCSSGIHQWESQNEQARVGYWRRRIPRIASLDRLLADGLRGAVRRQSLHRYQAQRRSLLHNHRTFRDPAPRRDASRSTSRSMRSTTSPAPPRPSTISTTRCRRPRPRCMARSTCSAWPSASSAGSCRPRPARSMATPTVHPQTEEYWGNVNPIGPRSCYDEGKRCAETLFYRLPPPAHMEIKSSASSTPTAPGCTPRMGASFSNFIMQALAGRADHHLWRWLADAVLLLCVDDLIEGLVRLMASPARFDRAGQSRQSGRDHNQTGRRGDHCVDWVAVAARVSAPA